MSEPDDNLMDVDAMQSPEPETGEMPEAEETPEQQEAPQPPSEPTQTPMEPPPPPPKEEKKRSRRKLGDLDLAVAKIGFIGAGKMAQCIIEGLINHGKIPPSNIFVAAPTNKNLEKLKTFGVKTSKRSIDIFSKFDCDVIFVCIHGAPIKNCYDAERPRAFTVNFIPYMRHPLYILSLVWGVKLHEIKACLLNPDHPEKYSIEMHRIMMNAACAYGLGICAIDKEPDSPAVTAPVRNLLSSIAKLEYLSGEQMDAACAIGGGGLAFAYYFINAMADGAFKVSLDRDTSIKFAAKTVHCATQCLLESGKHPDELRDFVSTPSGAAIYGIHVLDKADVASGVIAAVEAAHQRAFVLAAKAED